MIGSVRRLARLGELSALFVLLPALLFLVPKLPALPVLWVVALVCGGLLWKDPSFDRSRLWRGPSLAGMSGWLFLHFAFGSLSLGLLTVILDLDLFLSLPRQKPLLWLLVLVAYPLFSAFPQEVVYRAFFFHRYQDLLPGRGVMFVVNALLFSYMHIIFRNPIAVGLTMVGSLLFADAYLRSRSTLLASLVHSLYGWLVFTLGLGPYFQQGSLAIFSFQ